MLQQVNEDQAEALRRAADAKDRAKEIAEPKLKADHQRMAQHWGVLARAYEFQHALERFVSFQKSQQAARRPSIYGPHRLSQRSAPRLRSRDGDFLDRLARKIDAIRPFSLAALGIAIAAVSTATLLRWLSGSTVADLRFGIYVAAITATGLLAGVPAAIGASVASILVVAFAFVRPYFALKWPGTADQISLGFGALAALVATYFSHCCRMTLHRLHQRERANQILVNELKHRGRNMFSINEVILRKSLEDDPQRAEKIVGRFRAVQNANNMLTVMTARPITIRQLLGVELAPYGESRLVARGPEVEIRPDAVRHLMLLFHELITNAAKYGALSSPEGRILVEWQWKGGRRVALAWTESGGPEVLTPSRRGFGSQLMNSCLKSLDGSIETCFGRDGFSCNMTARIG